MMSRGVRNSGIQDKNVPFYATCCSVSQCEYLPVTNKKYTPSIITFCYIPARTRVNGLITVD